MDLEQGGPQGEESESESSEPDANYYQGSTRDGLFVAQEREQGIIPSSSGLSSWLPSFSGSWGTSDRMDFSNTGIESDADDNENQEDTAVADTNVQDNGGQRRRSRTRTPNLRAASRGPQPTRLNRLLGQLRIGSRSTGARQPRPDREARRSARRASLADPPPSQDEPTSESRRTRGRGLLDGLRNRLRRRRSPSQRQPSQPPSETPAPRERNRLRRRQPSRGAQRGTRAGAPSAGFVPGRLPTIPELPDRSRLPGYPPFIPVHGIPDLFERPGVRVTAAGGRMDSGRLPPWGDERLLARAFAGQATLGNAGIIWHAPPADMRPIPGHFQSHIVSLLGVTRTMYIYREGGVGANAVLATRQQNAN